MGRLEGGNKILSVSFFIMLSVSLFAVYPSFSVPWSRATHKPTPHQAQAGERKEKRERAVEGEGPVV